MIPRPKDKHNEAHYIGTTKTVERLSGNHHQSVPIAPILDIALIDASIIYMTLTGPTSPLKVIMPQLLTISSMPLSSPATPPTMVNETNVWYFDTGASLHMMCNHEWLHNFQPMMIEHNIVLGNDLQLPIVGCGTLKATVYSSTRPVKISLPDVILVLALHKNLLSPNKLLKNSYVVTLQDGGCEVCHCSSLSPLFTIMEQNNLLYMPLTAKPI